MRDKFSAQLPASTKDGSNPDAVALEKNFIKSSPFASFFMMVNQSR